MARIVVGITGASGIVLALKTISTLAELGYNIELIFTQHALYTAHFELGKEYVTAAKIVQKFAPHIQERIHLNAPGNMAASVCSGSYITAGMVIIPCSMASLAAISMGLGDNVLRRAADVTIKERRLLIIVPRETPFSEVHLENMLRLARMGVSILPPIPAWYNAPKTLEDVENFIVGKVLDLFKIEHQLYARWTYTKHEN